MRQAVGFVKGYMVQIGKKLKVISYTQASRRFKKLNLKIDDHRTNKDDLENIKIAVDSTRVSIYNNNGGHNTRKRKYSGYGQVRKLHVVLNANDKNSGVAVPVCDMLEEVSDKYNICSIRADAAYDIKSVYKECRILCLLFALAKICLAIRKKQVEYENYEDGINEWKKKVKYGARSYIEVFFYRLFGFGLKNKSEVNRVLIKCYLLNKFTDIGMAKFKLAA